jgi:potassium large conductance calcium-activated channel subfamily M alpha protein 1
MEDSAQIVKALAVHRFCGDKVRVIVEVLEPETQTSTVWDETRKGGIEIICPVKIHYKMIARRSVASSLSISSLSFSHCSSIISCMCKGA